MHQCFEVQIQHAIPWKNYSALQSLCKWFFSWVIVVYCDWQKVTLLFFKGDFNFSHTRRKSVSRAEMMQINVQNLVLWLAQNRLFWIRHKKTFRCETIFWRLYLKVYDEVTFGFDEPRTNDLGFWIHNFFVGNLAMVYIYIYACTNAGTYGSLSDMLTVILSSSCLVWFSTLDYCTYMLTFSEITEVPFMVKKTSNKALVLSLLSALGEVCFWDLA